MSERYVGHTVAWELPNGDSVTKSNYNLADIETKYMPIQTEVICDDKDKIIADLETKLAECEKSKESYRLQNEQHHLQLLQFYSRLGVEAFGADIHEKALETLMIMKEQLAEKTLTIEQINKAFIENRSLWKGKYERANQDKISFAVEQLEKVKELLNTDFESTISWIDPYEDGERLNSMTYNHNNTIKIIDNQIKQLREMSNEK